MLVLGRKPGECIIIDNKIKVEVIKSSKGDLRLAVDAPIDVKVIRGEFEKNK